MRFQGQTDIPLSHIGQTEARSAAALLAGVNFDRILSSDLSRAFQTAQAIAHGRDVRIERDVRLRERHFGAWEGLKWEEILQRYPQTGALNWTDPAAYVPDGGESFTELLARVQNVMEEVLSRPESRVLVVAHAGCMHAALHALFGEVSPSKGVRLEPGSITHVAIEQAGPRVVVLNRV